MMTELNLKNRNKGVLLVNLGTPDSPKSKDVKKFLKEMLSDKYLISGSAFKRKFLVNFCILPSRVSKSASTYKKIWTPEGSPLRVYMDKIAATLSESTGLPVMSAMRYGNPSLINAFKEFKEKEIDNILVIPFYPHSTLSTHITLSEEINNISEGFNSIKFKIIEPLAFNPKYIDSMVSNIKDFLVHEICEEVEIEIKEPKEEKSKNIETAEEPKIKEVEKKHVKQSAASIADDLKKQRSYILFGDHSHHKENNEKQEILENVEQEIPAEAEVAEKIILETNIEPDIIGDIDMSDHFEKEEEPIIENQEQDTEINNQNDEVEQEEQVIEEEPKVTTKKIIRIEDKQFDHIVFSFHGIPVSHIHSLAGHKECCFDESCKIKGLNYKCEKGCYWKQCHNTADAIAKQLDIKANKYSVAFQSRVGNNSWLVPELNASLSELAKSDKKSIIIVPTSFPVDCIETISELNEAGKHAYIAKGGKAFEVVPALNENQKWIETLTNIIEKW